jgi:hypothetical protein
MAVFYFYLLVWVFVRVHNSWAKSEVFINIPLTTVHPYEFRIAKNINLMVLESVGVAKYYFHLSFPLRFHIFRPFIFYQVSWGEGYTLP